MSQSRWKICLACVLLAGSVFSSVSSVWHPWEHPWIYRLAEHWGWVDHSPPRPKPFDPPMTTWFRTLPDSKGEQKAWIRFEGIDEDGNPITLELLDNGVREIDGKIVQSIEIVQTKESEETRRAFDIDRKSFRRGEFPADFLRSPRSNQETDPIFLQGLPEPIRYRRGTVRYLFTEIQEDAFTCKHARESVRVSDSEGRWMEHRCDIWVCEDLPFGVAKVMWTMRDSQTDRIVSRKTLHAVDCFPNPE